LKKCMRWSAVVGTGLTLALGSIAPAVAAVGAAPATVARPASATVAPSTLRLPADWRARSEAVAARSGLGTSPATAAVRRAVDPNVECGPTALDAYVDKILTGVSPADLQLLARTSALDFPTYDALVFGTSGDPDYALPADYRQQLTSSFRDAQRFWDIKSSDIQLMAMHGSGVLQDPERLVRLLTEVFGLTEAQAVPYAADVIALVKRIPALQGGNNPIFTLNAFAFSGVDEPDPLFHSLPDKLIFGDGILDALAFMKIADVGPRAVLGHEFGHHVQFEDNLFDSPLTGPEATRRTELMADAFGTYFATHSRGLSLNAKRVLQAEQTFYEVGDCAFTNPGHHGTPNQRLRASQWGANLASSAQKQGHILPSLTVAKQFDAALPGLVAR
jgi:hypothetical protein